MYFKVLKGTTLFDKLVFVQKEMQRVNKEAKKLANSLGIQEFYPGSELAGGIVAFHIPSGKPEGWAVFWKDTPHSYMPAKNKKENKELWGKIKALPILEYSVLNDVVGFKPNKHRTGNVYTFCPSVNWEDDYILLEFSDNVLGKYKPVEDMIEITATEYNNLKPKKAR